MKLPNGVPGLHPTWRKAIANPSIHAVQADGGVPRVPDAAVLPMAPYSGAAHLVYVDHRTAAAIGMQMGHLGHFDAATLRQLTASFCLAPAGSGESTGTVTAVPYYDFRNGDASGPRGDGRAGTLGAPVAVSDPKGPVSLYNFRIKGVPTPWVPKDIPPGDGHGTGRLSANNALADSVMSAALSANGVAVNRALFAFATKDPYNYHFVLGGQRIDFAGRVGFQTLVGAFDRIAQLRYIARQHPEQLRPFLDDVRAQVSLSLGRPLSHAGLFTWVVAHTMNDAADMYWTRAIHGSRTFDNIGLRESIDIATAAFVDRTHPTYRPISHISPGFAHEGELMMHYLSSDLRDAFRQTANPEELAQIVRLDVERMAWSCLTRRMSENAAEQLGFAPDAVTRLTQRHRQDMENFQIVLSVIADHHVEGATHKMSAADEAQDPARYDVFAGLASLVRIAESGGSREDKERALAQALAPLDPNPERDQRVAGQLLDAVAPLLHAELSLHKDPHVRAARARILTDNAERKNAPLHGLGFLEMRGRVDELLHAVESGDMRQVDVQQEIGALVRSNMRRGPDVADAVAHRIRHGACAQVDGSLELSRIVENGVLLQECSDGTKDVVRVTVAAEILERELHDATPNGFDVVVSFDGTNWQRAAAQKTADNEWRVDVATRKPSCIQVRLAPSGAEPMSDALCFGQGHQPVLGALAVDAELAAFAARQKQNRATDPMLQKAVLGFAHAPAVVPPPPTLTGSSQTK